MNRPTMYTKKTKRKGPKTLSVAEYVKLVDFIKENWKTLTDSDMEEITGFSQYTIRRIRLKQGIKRDIFKPIRTGKKRGKHLCWTCENACNFLKCEWVDRCHYSERPEVPEYCKTNEWGYIEECGRFVQEVV